MGLLNNIFGKKKKEVTASYIGGPGYGYNIYDGQKDIGMVGPRQRNFVDNKGMSINAENTYLIRNIAKTLIDRYVKWIISSGLHLDINPNIDVLSQFGIKYTREEIESINQKIETLFGIWGQSEKMCDYRGRLKLFEIQKRAFRTAKLKGDVLVILRVDKKTKALNIELIDSDRLMNPTVPIPNEDGGKWCNGIYINARGVVEKFCVSAVNAPNGYVEIDAVNKIGLTQAYLFSMDSFRSEDIRGLSALSGSMDVLASSDRYLNAIVESAEERSKVVFSIKHNNNSSGANPFAQLSGRMRGNTDKQNDNTNPIRDENGDRLTGLVMATTGKQVINMPKDSELQMHAAAVDGEFPEFISKIIEIIAPSIGIPSNVAMMLYNDSFSASRAAINDWMHTIRVDRAGFTSNFMQPIVDYWLYNEVLQGRFSLPAYLRAVIDGNEYVKTAFTVCEFKGEMFPHIDPLKEVNAVRASLGPSFNNVPLTTVENAINQLGNRNSDAVIRQAKTEFDEYSNDFNINSDNN